MSDSIPDAPAAVQASSDQWKYTGVQVIPSDSLDTNTAQTPGMSLDTTLVVRYGTLTPIRV